MAYRVKNPPKFQVPEPHDATSRFIPLSYGKAFALVDAEDYDRLSQWLWLYHRKSGYAYRNVCSDAGKKAVWMHREVAKVPEGVLTDHHNGNRLDNRKQNLRNATQAQNVKNRRMNKANRTGYKGVTFHRNTRKWKAEIQADGVRYRLGTFTDPLSAAKAYDEAAIRLHGQFAAINHV